MSPVLPILLVFLFPSASQQGSVQEPLQAQYLEAMSAGVEEGLPSLVRKLDAAANASPASPYAPRVLETIQTIALLHPGSVPDHAARLQAMKSLSSGNPEMAKALRRIEIVRGYYAAAAQGHPERAADALSDAVFENSLLGVQASADAALRLRDYARAEALAEQIIEADPHSPLLANAYVILGLRDVFMGAAPAAARHFQRALAITPLPTQYGNTQDLLAAIYRFVRPTPGAVGELFDDVAVSRLPAGQGLKDPRSLLFHQDKFILLDREQILSISKDGKSAETKPVRKIEDFVTAADGKYYYLAENAVDLGTGTWTPLSATIGGKPKALKKLRSLAVDQRGDVIFLDQDAGLFAGSPAAGGAVSLTALAPVRGRLVRVDGRGNIYVLGVDERSISVLSRDGKSLTTVSPAPAAGKEPSIEYFALDTLNHVYILDPTSIQIFAMNDGSAGLDKAKAGVIPFDARPQFKNLKVLAVSPTGEIAVTGKNDDNWVLFR